MQRQARPICKGQAGKKLLEVTACGGEPPPTLLSEQRLGASSMELLWGDRRAKVRSHERLTEELLGVCRGGGGGG